MSDDASWVVGLMRENYEAVGFLSITAIQEYLDRGLVIFQTDERGHRIGYLAHGPVVYGRAVSVAQHCIQIEQRQYGYGQLALERLVDRCRQVGALGIRLRCAAELPSRGFWLSQDFEITARVAGGRRRQRQIDKMARILSQPLFTATQARMLEEEG